MQCAMHAHVKNSLLHLLILINFSTCRDFYLGMFKKNDLLMSQDTLYKERVSHRFTYAKYGRKYNCPITYVRVLDRLNIGRGPRVEIIRGGLLKKYIVLRLTSPYNNPISVNIFVGCQNKKFTNPPWKIIRPTKKSTTSVKPTTAKATTAKTTTAKALITTTMAQKNEEENKVDQAIKENMDGNDKGDTTVKNEGVTIGNDIIHSEKTVPTISVTEENPTKTSVTEKHASDMPLQEEKQYLKTKLSKTKADESVKDVKADENNASEPSFTKENTTQEPVTSEVYIEKGETEASTKESTTEVPVTTEVDVVKGETESSTKENTTEVPVTMEVDVEKGKTKDKPKRNPLKLDYHTNGVA